MTKGIIILIAGHKHYAKMAAVLAASIRVVEDFPVVVLYNGNILEGLTAQERDLFEPIEVSHDLLHNDNGELNVLKARMHAYDLSPFDETLFLDADTVWISSRKPSDVFNELKDVPFTIQNNGHIVCTDKVKPDFSVWADLNDVIKAYDLYNKKFYRTFGEFIYFKKSVNASLLFDVAREVFLSKPLVKIDKFIGQEIPDELAFSIAMAQTGIYPHKDNYLPTSYYNTVSKRIDTYKFLGQLAKKYLLLSMGGSNSSSPLIEKYNIKSKLVYEQLGLTNPYQWINKRKFIKERLKM